MKKKPLVSFMLAGVISSGIFCGPAQALDYLQPPHTDYLYRTSRVTKEPAEKTFWDYLSFFAIKIRPEPEPEIPTAEACELRSKARELVQQLVQNSGDGLADEYVLTVNSFVNLNNLYATSSLGRYLSEQMIGELQAAGIGVIDVRKTNSLMIRESAGEYGLSRDINELRRAHDSQAVVVGTYTYGKGQILLNARVLRNSDGMVISHANTVFTLDGLTAELLKDEAMPTRRGGMVKIEAVN